MQPAFHGLAGYTHLWPRHALLHHHVSHNAARPAQTWSVGEALLLIDSKAERDGEREEAGVVQLLQMCQILRANITLHGDIKKN